MTSQHSRHNRMSTHGPLAVLGEPRHSGNSASLYDAPASASLRPARHASFGLLLRSWTSDYSRVVALATVLLAHVRAFATVLLPSVAICHDAQRRYHALRL